jgi:hypothetical protein
MVGAVTGVSAKSARQARALGEEGDRRRLGDRRDVGVRGRGQRQRGYGDLALAPQPQRDTAGDERPRAGAFRQHIR